MKMLSHTLKLVVICFLFANIGNEAFAEMKWVNKEFWTLGGNKQWTDQELDKAFAVFKRLKETYGDQFNLVVQDLHKEGSTRADGTKTAQIFIKIFVSPPNEKLEKELKELGLTYIK